MAIYPKMSLSDLRVACRQRADMVNSTFISDAELNSYINASYYELYDLLVQKYGNDYYMKEYSFQLQGNVSRYDLPDDFFKLLGVDLEISSGPDGYVSLRPFTLAERNRYSTANVQTWIGVTNLRYRISGNKLWFTPSPQTGQTIRIWYVPRLSQLVDQTTLTVADPVPAIRAELDLNVASSGAITTTLEAIDGGTAGNSIEILFTASGSGAGTLSAVGTSYTFQYDSGVTTVADFEAAVASFPSCLFSVKNAGAPGVLSSPGASFGWAMFSGGVNGDFVSIGATSLYATNDWVVGANNSITAANISAAINTAGIVDVSATSNGAVVTLVQDDAVDLALSVGGSTLGASTRLQFSSNTLSNGSQVADGISGWLEYVVTDVGIKMLQKEESDTSVLQLQKQALIRRIEAAAENRDAGSPATIADVQWTNGTWPFGNGFGGGGGIP